MDLDHLTTFRAVARSGSFTAAAAALHFAQSTVSVHIRALETTVGAPLFDRLPAGVRLTDAGRRLVPLADRILDLASAAAEVADDEPDATGELVLAAPETVLAHHLPVILRSLRDEHPAIRIRLEPVPYAGIPAAVATGSVDVAFLLQPPLRSSSSLAVEHLTVEPLRMVAGPEHALCSPGDLADGLARTTLFLTERGCGYRGLLEAHLDGLGVRPGHTVELDSVEAIRRCVEAGLGVALLPERWVTDPLRAGTLVGLDDLTPPLEVAVQLAWHPSRWFGPTLGAFVDVSRRCFGDRVDVAVR